MGNFSSKKPFFDYGDSLVISLSQFNFHEGSQISGTVSFRVTKPIP